MAEEIEIILEKEPQQTCEDERGLQEPSIDESIEQLQRLQAEFDNYRKRTMRQREQWTDEIRADFCKQLLSTLDDIARALEYSADDPASLRKGLELINKNLSTTLQTMGLASIPAAGRPFDPQVHEAVMVQMDPCVRGEMVIAELQRGYLYKERLLRPAKVKVSKSPQEVTDGCDRSSVDGSLPSAAHSSQETESSNGQ